MHPTAHLASLACLAIAAAPAHAQITTYAIVPSNYATTEGSNATRVSVRIAYDNGHRSDSRVITLPFDEGTEPYAILSWQDALQPATDQPAGIAWR